MINSDKSNKSASVILKGLSLCLYFSFGYSRIVDGPVDTEVHVGDATRLDCIISPTDGDLSWLHYAVGVGTNSEPSYVYLNGVLVAPYHERFRVEQNLSTGSFSLILTAVELEDAGLYVCQNGQGASKAASAQLTVLESLPVCQSNLNRGGMIGPNNCDLKQDTIRLSCSINYKGNIYPKIQFEKIKDENAISVPTTQYTCSKLGGRLECNYSTHITLDLQNSQFVCRTTRGRQGQYSCANDVVTIHYAASYKMSTFAKVVGDTVICSVNTSSNECKYTWTWSDGTADATVASDEAIMTVTKVGSYWCEASCNFKHQSCSFNAMTILVTSTGQEITTTILIVVVAAMIVAGLFIICTVAFVICALRKKRRTSSDTSNRNSTMLDRLQISSVRTETQDFQNVKNDLTAEFDRRDKMDELNSPNQTQKSLNYAKRIANRNRTTSESLSINESFVNFEEEFPI